MLETNPLEESGALPVTAPYSLATQGEVLLRDDWDLNNDLQQARRHIEQSRRDGDDEEGLLAGQFYRSAAAAEACGSESENYSVVRTRSLLRGLFAAFAWIVICTGAMALTFAGGLLVCTIFFNRPDLWNWGLLTALTGQLVIFLGCAGRLANARWTAPIANRANAPSPPIGMKAPFRYENPSVSPPWTQRTEAALAASLDIGSQT